MAELTIRFKAPGPVAGAFGRSRAFIRSIMGPLGSGKSTTCCAVIWNETLMRKPGPDGWRRARWAIVRNTQPELRTTTMKTWFGFMPQEFGHWVSSGPPRHTITDRRNKVELEVLFMALDTARDVKKLLSLDITGAWLNEGREIPKAVLDGLTGRVGRFPRRGEGEGWFGVIIDTNPPDTDHWYHVIAERDQTTERAREMLESILAAERVLREEGVLAAGQPLFEFFRQPGGLEPNAENVKNLPPGYYPRLMAGKSSDWIKVYVHAQYGFVQDGKPVYPDYLDTVHCAGSLTPARGIPLRIGLDFGLTPAAAIAQRMPNGAWRVLEEIVTDGMGVIRFGGILAHKLREKYQGFPIDSITGDPAGDARMPDDETQTTFTLLKQGGIVAKPAPTNDFGVRVETVTRLLTTMVDGAPALLVDPSCHYLRRGMAGAYRYRRIAVRGDDRYTDEPEKNLWSHICEALQYDLLGGGEGRITLRGKQNESRSGRQRYATE